MNQNQQTKNKSCGPKACPVTGFVTKKAQLDFNGCSDVGSSKYSTAVDLNLDLNSNAYSCLLTVQLYTWPYTAVLSQLVTAVEAECSKKRLPEWSPAYS